MKVPPDLKYTSTHEWVRVDGDVATVGITEYAQKELGDIVYVDLPNVGRALGREENCGSIESVKTVSDVYSPIKGEVIETNPMLGGQSDLINSDPYGSGWIFRVRMSDPAEVGSLLEPSAYEAILD